jgi:hypothetical protein
MQYSRQPLFSVPWPCGTCIPAPCTAPLAPLCMLVSCFPACMPCLSGRHVTVFCQRNNVQQEPGRGVRPDSVAVSLFSLRLTSAHLQTYAAVAVRHHVQLIHHHAAQLA